MSKTQKEAQTIKGPGNDLPVKIASQTILNHVLTAGNVVLLAISQEIARNRRETKSDF